MTFCLKLGASTTETFKMLKVALGKQVVRKTQVFELICKLKIWMNSIMLNNQEAGQQEKQMKMWIVQRNLSCKIEVSLCMRLVTFQKVQLAQFMTFLKGV